MAYKKVYLKPGKEESLKRFHPWVFSGAIQRIEGEPEEGEIVDVYTSKKEFIACGHFQIGSIAVRVLSFKEGEIDHEFWKHKLEVAYDLRRSLGLAGNPANNTYRLVHGEGDNLPGLIIDVYDHTAVMQAHSAGMHVYRMEIADALSEVMGDVVRNIYYKSETTLPFKADLEPENGFIKGGSSENIAMEYGLKFHVDWLKGQKTGFFVDQRENRHLLERYAKGRNVLNMFCYTGGFSFYAMRGGANLVLIGCQFGGHIDVFGPATGCLLVEQYVVGNTDSFGSREEGIVQFRGQFYPILIRMFLFVVGCFLCIGACKQGKQCTEKDCSFHIGIVFGFSLRTKVGKSLKRRWQYLFLRE